MGEKLICENCGHEVDGQEYYEEHHLVEEHYECPACGFRRHWEYGHPAPEDSEFPFTLQSFAALLDGRPYMHPQFTETEVGTAARNGFVIVYGASDDLMEFEGAVSDEVECYDGGTIFLGTDGNVSDAEGTGGRRIEACWCSHDEGQLSEDGEVIPWTYKTDIPHETFMLYEDSGPYCRGIVFSMPKA